MKGYFKQDGDCHWYFIPSEEVEEFDRLLQATEGKDYMDAPDEYDEFNDKFSEYQTGGGIEDIEVDNLE